MVDSELPWQPKRTIQECDQIITAPGQLHELEHAFIDGRVYRVYKNLPPSLRVLWLGAVEQFKDKDYLVFENERYTYAQAHEKVSRLASLLYTKYGVRKGDRVAIIMRNFPEFVIAFWATQLLGAVATLINAWVLHEPLVHCITKTNPKVIIVDPERADRLAGSTLDEVKRRTSLHRVLVARTHEVRSAKWKWKGMSSLEDTIAAYDGPADAWAAVSDPVPEDDATIFFTSGTTGLPKGVLSTQRQFITNFFNALVTKFRALLRNGEEIPEPDPNEMQKAVLISVPLFHVTGNTSTLQIATGLGWKVVLMRKWDKDDAARLIIKERISSAGGVPSMVMDLIETSLESSHLESLSCGGAPASDTMPKDVLKKFKKVVDAGQGYGLSETNAISTTISGEDFLARPASCGLAAPVVDLLVVDPSTMKILPPNQIGELWIRGINVMKGYYLEQDATDKAISRDGWFRSGDLATIDEEGFVYIKDRFKDIIIRGGENIHSVEVENALYADEKIIDAAAVSVPDKRLGELVAAVVATKPHYRGQVTEEEVIEVARTRLPAHAVPVIVLVQDEMIERNANGKIMKDSVRKRVRKEWARRLKEKAAAQSKDLKARL